MEIDFEKLRREMVENQIIRRGITNKKVIAAFLKVPREEFVPEQLKESAYDDTPLPIGEGQTISQPYIVALMTESLTLKENEKVLEIGTGSGYQSAILAEIGCEVYSIEKIESLAKKAEKTLKKLGYNVKIKIGDGTLGWEEFSPYDKIIVTAASPKIPKTLLSQLSKNEGKLIIPIGDRFSQDLILFIKRGEKIEKINLGGCQFVPLIGKEGWEE
ncbi:MAG: protein-L-isoaspartate(D-aspartate) O-methyltransferase [Candidatus Omnitrophica bacterium]|nr:protein-L-isoaspartate(D-aspartate) O-methyltransferase [Candidatus Omnitrophota bacterium]MCM8808966.1 protein-L-isoaspartate(D-aspartate) O-methyltransferase [Candidatus Omnitrophota bacterium]MCM8811256.1 protein-L-isoaspartate(D-aspartate) O-methyltransferase [Candidatus Omnitrophota bacterium]